MAHWKDVTSYRRGQERVPKSWATEIGGVRISVVSQHIATPGRWVITCHDFGMDARDLGLSAEVPAEEAQDRALLLVRQKVRAIARAFEDEA